MQGLIINPDKRHVDLIMMGLHRKKGVCPCKLQFTPEQEAADMCPCDELIATKVCHCKLYIPVEEVKP